VKTSRRAAVASILALAVVTTGILAASGYDVRRAGIALVSGSVGSWYALTSATLVRATPLILTGLAVAIAFRGGVFNIGAEGQFLVGAAAAAAAALSMPAMPRIVVIAVVLLMGAAAGMLWSAIAAVLRTRFHVLEVISTIMLNFIALHLISYLVRGPLQEASHIYPQTDAISVVARLPRFGTTRLHFGFLIGAVACVVAWWWIRSTASGFRLRAVGANPLAAESAGQINTRRVITGAFLTSGALAGLAGAIEVAGVTFALYENMSPGYGYTAIAVALLARLHALAVLLTAFLFGALEAGATAMQRDAGVPSVLVSIVEAGVVLTLVAWGRHRIVGGRST
jgi:general nucleoside transport system permease protein